LLETDFKVQNKKKIPRLLLLLRTNSAVAAICTGLFETPLQKHIKNNKMR